MTDLNYNVQKIRNIEDIANKEFGIDLYVKNVVVSDVISGKGVYTTLFVDTSNILYALTESDTDMTLGAVITIIKSMNLEAMGYLAPHRDSEYFQKQAVTAYEAVFPGRNLPETDMSFYQKLSRYNPALIQIRRITGDLQSYNTVSKRWRKEYDESVILQAVKNNV